MRKRPLKEAHQFYVTKANTLADTAKEHIFLSAMKQIDLAKFLKAPKAAKQPIKKVVLTTMLDYLKQSQQAGIEFGNAVVKFSKD